ncbi:glycosyltransferase [Helicobacter saguini]|uniref:Glycosyltransferase family 2 protein n=1 Tax=Helicobacter saguini TaxID=1548018 RepID=A0A347VMM9_9HELI|nr:glycosyltransferase [Helicobacter saguini]MWV68045.1 glycosyltransferase [Helicobacter saguini]MWV72392.1 glycosyltransferase [Helicobacter saguini]TLD92358.1 glycosyltransferase family 2 protein [Helicobacter saguini]
MKVGVVVPMFGVAAFLRECLDSILNQSYKNLNVLLISDGDLDCLNIALEYAALDSRFIVIDKENGGQATGRNVGIEFFSGVYKIVSLRDFALAKSWQSSLESNIESKGDSPLPCVRVGDLGWVKSPAKQKNIESNLQDSIKTSKNHNLIESTNIESNNLYCYKVLDSKTYIYIYIYMRLLQRYFIRYFANGASYEAC